MSNKTYIPFDASKFSSRKLLTLVEESQSELPFLETDRFIEAAVQELSCRGHYLNELAARGLIDRPSPD